MEASKKILLVSYMPLAETTYESFVRAALSASASALQHVKTRAA